MVPTTIERIAQEVSGAVTLPARNETIDRICIDSRGVSPRALFFALAGRRTDGHKFLSHAFANGAAAAIVAARELDAVPIDPEWPLIVVPSPLRALQSLARWYRREMFGQVLAITGSNGKTIVKDALGAFLERRAVFVSPGSYNSQLGLPLAVLSAEKRTSLAIFEAGISEPGEMAALEDVLRPDFGILTNIGMAHFASFGSREALAREKITLFERIPETGWVLLPSGEPIIKELAGRLRCRIHWLGSDEQVLAVAPLALVDSGRILSLSFRDGGRYEVRVGTRSPEIISDLHFAASAACLLGVKPEEIAATLESYVPVPTRMEMWSSPDGVRIINDAYSADPISVHSALRAAALGVPPANRKIFVFAGMRELGSQSDREHRQVGAHAAACGFSHLFLVGDGELDCTAEGYDAEGTGGSVLKLGEPAELKEHLLPILRPGDTVLFKGPRKAGMVGAARDIAGSIAQRCLWVDLAAVGGNVARFRRHAGGGVRILAVLKALAYGTDLIQLASWMSDLGIQDIGVSSTSEGVAARKTGIGQEVFVFLPDPGDIDSLIRYRLTPVIYSPELAEAFLAGLEKTGRRLDVHLKVNTGMNRLGLMPQMVTAIARRILDSGAMRVTGICTHFAAADDPRQDDFTRGQIALFNRAVEALRAMGHKDLVIHAANTAAAIRFPEAHYDMVRIGLGLYGIYPSEAAREHMELDLAIGVTSRIAHIHTVSPGESLGYNLSYTTTREMKVGTVPFGYADGMPWRSGQSGHVLVEGKIAPIVGRISMDQLQVDVTNIEDAGVGSEVLLYGARGGYVVRPEHVAAAGNTIPHELLTRLGRRVHRIYLEP